MAKQSNLEKIGLERRQEQIIRNDIRRDKPYNADHDTAVWHGEESDKPLGKGTKHGGHGHTLPKTFNEETKQYRIPQLDTANGGGAYDINGRPGVGGGRKFLQTINVYGPENRYDESIDTSENIEDGQFFLKD